MAVKHRIECFDSELLVRQTEEGYQLSIQTAANPLGFGIMIETFDSEERAAAAAQQFRKMYTVAREKGYYFRDNSFTKPEGKSFPVATLLYTQMTDHELGRLLEAEVK